jgi:hypothetical protein
MSRAFQKTPIQPTQPICLDAIALPRGTGQSHLRVLNRLFLQTAASTAPKCKPGKVLFVLVLTVDVGLAHGRAGNLLRLSWARLAISALLDKPFNTQPTCLDAIALIPASTAIDPPRARD